MRSTTHDLTLLAGIIIYNVYIHMSFVALYIYRYILSKRDIIMLPRCTKQRVYNNYECNNNNINKRMAEKREKRDWGCFGGVV